MRLQLALVLVLAANVARADGVLELRGAYYKERSTRVEQPMLDAAFDTGDRGQVAAHFLVDSITSASSSTGAQGGQFTERRWEAGIGYTQELAGRLKLGGDFRYSTESDYYSTWIDAHAELALAEQSTRLRALVGHSFDTITNGVAVEQGAIGLPPQERSLGVSLLELGLTQIVTPQIVGAFGVDLGYLNGYQANLYRVVRGGDMPFPERVPDVRWRTAFSVELRGYLEATGTTAIASYRLYVDDWGIVAHTPEARIVQRLADGVELRLRYRFYTQNKADFYEPVYTEMQLEDPKVSVTADEKLSAFRTHTVGGQFSFAVKYLGFPGVFGSKTRVDFIVERVFQTTSFGDAWVGQLGVSIPFVY